MSNIRYLLDENVNPVLRSALLSRKPNLTVWQVGIPGAPAFGTLDPEILIWCQENDFILITHNRKSMPVHLAEHLTNNQFANGILTLNEDISVGETVEELVLIASASELEEYRDLILYLPIT